MNSVNNPGLLTQINSNFVSRNIPNIQREVRYARVLQTVLSKADVPEELWKPLGGSQTIYGVFYQDLYNREEKDLVSERFAYCMSSTVKRIPLKNEIVTLVSSFSAERAQSLGNSQPVECMYWEEIIPVWNTPHYNPWPDINADGSGQADAGKDFKESAVYPLQLLAGDVAVEGRYGNSIRFGGTKGNQDLSPLVNTDLKNSGKAYTIIRNGQAAVSDLDKAHLIEYDDNIAAVNEDINKDPSSIYLTSDHKIPLVNAHSLDEAWLKSDKPGKYEDYQGCQALVNADRVVLNARKNDAYISAKEKAGLAANKVGITATKYIGLDANKIFLGQGAQGSSGAGNEPVLLGNETIDWLKNLLTLLERILDHLVKAGLAAGSDIGSNATAGMSEAEKSSINGLRVMLQNLPSKKVYTE